ncbi:coat protein [Tobacco leaf curl Puer virus]|uniref:Protein V2 n=1 Tax=Tobacco leaf curl Puer virus TaxID=2886212 RepID=A0AAE9C3W3_9GEMI|nr:coat protein [Tobacco leaf curl Puer virus]
MWDPLLNEFPLTLYGFRSMLAIKYLQVVENTYPPNSVGRYHIRYLIQLLRRRNVYKASEEYADLISSIGLQGSTEVKLRQPNGVSDVDEEGLDLQAHVSQAQNVQNVQKP